MTTEIEAPEEVGTTTLRLSSYAGPITLPILNAPPRDALPSEIPIINIASIFSSSLSSRQAVAEEIRIAAMNTGFFYITGHGVDEEVTDSTYHACLDFFRQDLEVKKRADSKKSAYFNGYKGPKTQRINPNEGVDVRETFSWTYDPRDDPNVEDVNDIPGEARQFMRPEDFPWEATSHMPQFKKTIVVYFRECLRVARALTKAFALSLGLEEEFFGEKVKFPDTAFAFNYYPPLPPPDPMSKADQTSIGSHTDFQLFTILWQDTVGGLQVLNRSGQWLNAPPKPGTFVVNIGDYLQKITSGRYKSTVHRARNLSGKERVSMPFFWGFGLHESCEVLEDCGDGKQEEGEIVRCEEWVQRRVRAMLTVTEGERGI